jgi:hypothetical protein
MPWLFFAQPYDPSVPGVTNVYFSDIGFVSSPSDSPANIYWDRRLETPFTIQQSLYSGTSLGGRSELSIGNAVLSNQDGFLDYLADYDWDGRLVEIKYTSVESPILSDFVTVFSGTAERISVGDEITVEIRDLQILLDKPLQPNRFLGTGGVEGPTEFKDRPKPKLYGVRRQFTPILLNETSQVWCFSDTLVGGPTTVLDRGDPLTFNADYASYAALTAASISAGFYGTCNALGLIRLGGPPVGVLTIDAEGSKIGGAVLKKFGDLAVQAVTDATDLTSSDFEAGTVTAMNTTCPQTLGLWYDGSSEITVRSALDILSQSVGVFYGFNSSGKIVLNRLDEPKVTEDFSFEERDIISLSPLPVERRLKTQIVKWGERIRPLEDQEIVGSITGSARQALIERWRQEKYEDTAVTTASLLAKEETLESLFDLSTDAATEAQRRVDLYGAKRYAYSLSVRYEPDIYPGDTIKITDSRFQLTSGKNFIVIRITKNAVDDESTMEVWG